jgi:hypothetical protein
MIGIVKNNIKKIKKVKNIFQKQKGFALARSSFKGGVNNANRITPEMIKPNVINIISSQLNACTDKKILSNTENNR